MPHQHHEALPGTLGTHAAPVRSDEFAVPRIVTSLQSRALDKSLLGGKAANLATLEQMGMPVPAWLCVTTKVYEEVLAPLHSPIASWLRALDYSDREQLRATSMRITEEIQKRDLPLADREALLREFDELFPKQPFVAVRSSAVGEDSAKDSFAGQMDTFLFVTRDELVSRVLACFASAYSERAILYRRMRKHSAMAKVAVVIQQMVDSRVSGILFTRDPMLGHPDQAVISAGLGLGEGIVSDKVESDTYHVELATGRLLRQAIRPKRSRVVFNSEERKGTRLDQISPEEGAKPALDANPMRELTSLGRSIEDRLGKGQDIEWAIDQAGKLFVLQARPITTLTVERETIFDNSNIVESYPGISLPLTFSFARAGYEIVLRDASRRYGVPAEVIEAHREALHANLVAFLSGRIYYNILNWYRFIEIMPGFEWMLPAWEKALGIPPRERPAPKTDLGNRLTTLKARVRIGARFLTEHLQLERNVKEMLRVLREAQEEMQRLDLGALDPHGIVELAEGLRRKLFPPYSIENVNDDAAQQLFELLGVLIKRWQLGPEELRNSLFAGEKDLVSVEPLRSLLDLSKDVAGDPSLRKLFDSEASDEEVWQVLASAESSQPFRRKIALHVERYGDRTLHELKLETPTLEENPAFMVSMIRNYLRSSVEIQTLERHEHQLREQAERAVAERLKGHPARARAFAWVLAQARRMIRNRETLRLARSRGFGLFKRLYRELGRRFAEAGMLDEPFDLFYLTIEEVADVVRGAQVTSDLRGLVALRKRDYERYRAQNLHPRIRTRGIVYAKPFADRREGEAGVEGEVLRGIGCASGKVAARAKIVIDPQGNLDIRGQILVASTTDPGWVFLMAAAKGLVAEKGSPLSHTAIVGRELGIPTVVGVEDATCKIKNDQWIEIDGHEGTVRLGPASDTL